LLIAAQFGFKKIVGVEFSGELCKIARDNVIVFTRKTNITAQIDVIESDAADFPIAADYDIFFMNNPFDGVVMNRLLENLRHSMAQSPRTIWFIYHNPDHGDIIGRSGLFRACQEFQTSGGRFRVYNS
jgi:tRNA1(Val) A37 N6-methylase TrmN6